MLYSLACSLGFLSLASGVIVMNGQDKITNYPNTVVDAASYDFVTYPANATEISYKGRWDSRKVSWWS